MLKAIIVDDEQHCSDRVAKLLQGYRDTLMLVATCNSLSSAKKAISELSPDVVFLDVQLQAHTGFELLSQLPKVEFQVVFTTAYDSYAVEAFRFSALDYLLKPIDEDEFEQTVGKIKQMAAQKETAGRLETLFHNFEHQMVGMKKLAIPGQDYHTIVNVNDIIRCQSDSNYTHIFTISDKKITATKTLKYFEELIQSPQFFRVHKSHYINIAHVKKYIKGKNAHVQMADGAKVEIAVRRKDEFHRKLMS